MHHVKHHAKGGQTILANCLAVCPNCHKEIHRETA
jgi:5-methylcytosine-specific restriction endonuclease McrA